ncbi:MAG: hypothetical protein CBC38_02150 [Gammaproteobacteria bacterium TMED78]|nr:MAG: hypothetical protein CBC38_02150 [Gammaproteobacteria bacterium TMED78]
MKKDYQFVILSIERALKVLLGDQSIKDRLYNAYSEYIADLDVSSFPKDLQEKFIHLHSIMHKKKSISSNDQVLATIRKMSALEASVYSKEIFSIYRLIASYQLEKKEPLGPLKVKKVKKEIKSVPKFLSKSS